MITSSSFSASRRYLDRSSFTFASATFLGWDALGPEPRLDLLLRDDGEDFDSILGDVIEHPDPANTESIPRTTEAAEPLDSAPAHSLRLAAEMDLECVTSLRPNVSVKGSQLASGARCENPIVPHSGQSLARLLVHDRAGRWPPRHVGLTSW